MPEPDGAASAASPGTAWFPAAGRAAPCASDVGASTAAAPAESHIRAGGARKTVFPFPSTAVRFPEAPVRTSSPFVLSRNDSFFNSGAAAASGVLTTSTCWKLSGVAVTIRSTSGNTSS
ncbi:hypothetical protein SMICM304S_12222 [Streptomyces microflavus]